MGRHVNHHDVQDRMIVRNSKIANYRSGSIDNRDPSTLSIAEQEKLLKEKLKNKKPKPEPKRLNNNSFYNPAAPNLLSTMKQRKRAI